MPVLARSTQDKTRLRSVFGLAFAITSTFYIVIGMTIALYFGKGVRGGCACWAAADLCRTGAVCVVTPCAGNS